MSRSRLTRGLALAAFLFTTGCGAGAGTGEWTGTVRDSAGIVVVDNPATGVWRTADRWYVEEDLRIGVVAGDPAYQFGQPADVAPLSDGRIVVRDGQAQEIRIFDRDGRYLATVGGAGSGPGELSPGQEGVVILPGDTVLAPDMMLQRVNRFTPDGQVAEGFALRLEDGAAVRWDVTADGRLVQQAMALPLPGMTQDSLYNQLLLRAPDGTVLDTLAVLPLGETLDMSTGAPAMRVFSSEPVWALDPAGRLITGSTSDLRFEVRRLDGDGSVERVFWRPHTPRPISQADQTQLRRMFRQVLEQQQQNVPAQVIEMVLAQIQFADFYPAMTDLLVGPEGTLWVQHVFTPSEGALPPGMDMQDLGAPRWDVFDADGRFLGTVELPERFRLTRIAGDALYGVLRDEFDVPYVTRLRLIRPEAAPGDAAA